jgi:hypothetical protein
MRVGYSSKPFEKKMEVFQNFTGGLNTVSPPDGMTDTELTDMLNQDISERGSLKRRHGMEKLKNLPAGKTQGYFRYYKTDGTYDELFAISGQMYRNDEEVALTITGLSSFQDTKPVEAVQFGGTMYIATGTKLLQYDGTTLAIVDPYLPTTQEMTYLGPNILAENPESHLQDTVGLVASIDQVLPHLEVAGSRRWLSAQVFCTKIDGEDYLYALQVRSAAKASEDWPAISDSQWIHLNDVGNWLGADMLERWNGVYMYGKVASDGDYEIRVVMKKVAVAEILSECVLPFTVSLKKTATKPATYTVHQCNRILLHWDRIFLYGDPDNPATVYMSHTSTPNYVPALSNLEFDSPKREPLTTIVHYRNSLVLFTKSSTQALYGSSPDDFRRVMLHTDLGCVSPYGAAVMKNHIGFVSLQGIYVIKTMGLTDDKASVEKIDIKIANIIPKDQDAIVVYNDGQLQVTFPTQKQRFRFYEELGAWTKDYSDKFGFTGMWNIDGEIYGQSENTLYRFSSNVYKDDDYVYENYWESKYLNFGQPYHKKKLKELQILSAPNDDSMTCTIYVYADEEAVINPDESYASVVDGAVVWVVSEDPNFNVAGGTTFDDKWVLGESVLGHSKFAVNKLSLTGKCLRTRIRVVNNEPKENHFMGFAYVFKIKKP